MAIKPYVSGSVPESIDVGVVGDDGLSTPLIVTIAADAGTQHEDAYTPEIAAKDGEADYRDRFRGALSEGAWSAWGTLPTIQPVTEAGTVMAVQGRWLAGDPATARVASLVLPQTGITIVEGGALPPVVDTGEGTDTGTVDAVVPLPDATDSGEGTDTAVLDSAGDPSLGDITDSGEGADSATIDRVVPVLDVTDSGEGSDVGVLDAAYILAYDFIAANDNTSEITDDFYTWANLVSADAVIDLNTYSVQSNKLSARITPTVNAKFVNRDFVAKTSFAMPTSGQTRYIEASIGYPSVRENQIGIGVNGVSENTDPGRAGIWSPVEANNWSGASRFRAHLSQAASLSAGAARVEHYSGGTTSIVSSTAYTVPTNQTWTYRVTIAYTAANTYTVTLFVNGEQVHQSTGVNFTEEEAYLHFYNQTAHTTADTITFDTIRVW